MNHSGLIWSLLIAAVVVQAQPQGKQTGPVRPPMAGPAEPHNASRSLKRILKGHIDAALTICNSMKLKTEVSREGDVFQQLPQLIFSACEVH